MLCTAPNIKVNLLQRKIANRVYKAVCSGSSADKSVTFSNKELSEACALNSNNTDYLNNACYALNELEAWVNPFNLTEEPKTYRLFESVSVNRGRVVFVLTPWAYERLIFDDDRVAVPIHINNLGYIDAALMEICASYLKDGSTPKAPRQHWRKILNINVQDPDGTRWFTKILKRPIERLKNELNLKLVAVRDRGGICFKIEHSNASNALTCCNDSSKTSIFVARGQREHSAGIFPNPAFSQESPQDDVDVFVNLFEEWNVKAKCLIEDDSGDTASYAIPGDFALDHRTWQSVPLPKSNYELEELIRALDKRLNAASKKADTLRKNFISAANRERDMALELIRAIIVRYGIEMDDLIDECF